MLRAVAIIAVPAHALLVHDSIQATVRPLHCYRRGAFLPLTDQFARCRRGWPEVLSNFCQRISAGKVMTVPMCGAALSRGWNPELRKDANHGQVAGPTATGGAGHLRVLARTGAVTLIQRFGGSLNLNIHFHVLMLDGVYVTLPAAEPQESESSPVACIAGFSLHAGVAAEAHQRDKVRSHRDREGALGYSVIHPLFDRLILQPPACIPEIPPTTGQTRFFCFNSEHARYFGYIIYSTYPRGSGLPVGFRVKIHGKKAID